MGKSEPVVSVIVPCYNERDYIEKCVMSIIGQEFPYGEFEIIIVDGLSNDGTREILRRLAENYTNITLVDNEKHITPAAFNLGIKCAKGKYISILGAHSEYDPHFLSGSIKLFIEHPEISCSGGPIISKGKSNFGIAAALAMSHPLGVGNAKHRFPEYEGFAEGACFPTFKKEVFSEIGLYDEYLLKNQDDELNFRLARNGKKVFLSPHVKSIYYVRDNPKALFNQYYSYGFWKVKVIRKHRKIKSLRHIVPTLFFLLMLILFFLGLLLPLPFKLMMFALPVSYLVIISLFSVKVGLLNNFRIAANFILAVVILHFSYGMGFIASIFNRR